VDRILAATIPAVVTTAAVAMEEVQTDERFQFNTRKA
jgi:hypothetical protein